MHHVNVKNTTNIRPKLWNKSRHMTSCDTAGRYGTRTRPPLVCFAECLVLRFWSLARTKCDDDTVCLLGWYDLHDDMPVRPFWAFCSQCPRNVPCTRFPFHRRSEVSGEGGDAGWNPFTFCAAEPKSERPTSRWSFGVYTTQNVRGIRNDNRDEIGVVYLVHVLPLVPGMRYRIVSKSFDNRNIDEFSIMVRIWYLSNWTCCSLHSFLGISVILFFADTERKAFTRYASNIEIVSTTIYFLWSSVL